MKKSQIIAHSPYQIDKKTQNYDIPKCESFQEFFKIKGLKKKKKNNFLAFSVNFQNTGFIGQSTNYLSQNNNAEQKIAVNDALTSITDTSSTCQKGLTFKKSLSKPKMSKVDSLTYQDVKKIQKFQTFQTNSSGNPSLNLSKQNLYKQNTNKNNIKKRKFTIQDFKILKKIGEGSYSKVFLAVEKTTGFVCSLKMISKKSIKQQNILHVVIRQLKIHHYLNHKNIVDLYSQFDDQEYLYLICQYCTQGDLHKFIRNKNKQGCQIDIIEIAHFVKQICSAVAAMHKDYLMHRDIKPQNVFLSLGNQVKLGDFGWSVYCGDHQLRNTQCGTPLYLAPQLVQQNQYSETVDIWAIGVLTYQLLTGQIPFKIKGTHDLNKIVNQAIKFEYIDNDLARDFVMKLLQKDAKLRMEIEDVLQHPFLKIQESD